MQLTIKQALPLIRIYVAADKPIMLWGAPGIGKSQLVAQLALEAGAKLIDIRLSYFDPVDLRGIPFVVDGVTYWACPSIWPTNGELTYLFFDELSNCPPALQAAAYQAILERRIGEIQFGPNVRVFAAGNRQEDKAISFKMSSALANRMGHIDLIPDGESLVTHFAKIGVRADVIALLNMPRDAGNEIIYNIADSDYRTFPSPRAWESVSVLVNEAESAGAPDSLIMPLVASVIGEGPAAEYCGMRRVFHSLPKLADVINSPDTAKLPPAPDSCFAITAALARIADASNLAAIVRYLGRLDPDNGGVEFATRAVAQIVAREPKLKETRAFIDWSVSNQHVAL